MKNMPRFFVHSSEPRRLIERKGVKKGREQMAYVGAIPNFDFAGIISVLLER